MRLYKLSLATDGSDSDVVVAKHSNIACKYGWAGLFVREIGETSPKSASEPSVVLYECRAECRARRQSGFGDITSGN